MQPPLKYITLFTTQFPNATYGPGISNKIVSTSKNTVASIEANCRLNIRMTSIIRKNHMKEALNWYFVKSQLF